MSRIKVNLPIGSDGDWSVKNVTGDSESIYTNVMGVSCGGKSEPFGNYTFLYNNQYGIVMSDTHSEHLEHKILWNGATGDVLVAGLGLGYVNEFLMNNPNITSVTIIEKNQEVINLVWPHCPKNQKFTLINDDIETWSPPNGSHWHFGWFDSWTSQSAFTDYQSYQQFIRNKYQTYCDSIEFWAGE